MNTFLIGVAVGVVAGVISGVVLAVILGAWRGVLRYLGSMLNDMRLTLAAFREGKYQEAHAHDRRATMKMLGCLVVAVIVQVVCVISALIVEVAVLAANPKH